tara:strand:- start:104 stop:403 length:300 start_codon:yes stop_codon:yes gene_type:complete
MTDKHTPGPWTIFDGAHPGIDGGGLSIVVYGKEDEPLYGVQGWNAGEALANARLIAAAPDLLEALQQLGGILVEAPPSFSDSPAVKKARIAIAKATQEQ